MGIINLELRFNFTCVNCSRALNQYRTEGHRIFGLNGPWPGKLGNVPPGLGLCTGGTYANTAQTAASNITMNTATFILYMFLWNIKARTSTGLRAVGPELRAKARGVDRAISRQAFSFNDNARFR